MKRTDLLYILRFIDNTQASEWFEFWAEEFQRVAGMMPPGKDQPAAMCGTPDDETRRVAWENFMRNVRAKTISLLKNEIETPARP